MECYIKLFQIYLEVGTRHILKEIYFTDIFPKKKMLWVSSILMVVTAVVMFVWFRERGWVSLPIIAVGAMWAHYFWGALISQFSRYYEVESTKKKLSFYGEGYEYLRYLFFKEKATANGNNIQSCIDDALKYLDIALSTEHRTAITGHPFIASMITITFAVIGGSVGLWGGKTIATVSAWLVIILLVGFMFVSVSKGKKGRSLEFKRFLLWLRDDV